MKKRLSELIISIIVLLYGVFLLLCGLGVFPFSIKRVAFLSTCICLFGASVVVAVVQRNLIGLFFTLTNAVLVISAVLLLIGYSSRNVYPLYIASIFAGGMGISRFTPSPRPIMAASSVALGVAVILTLESFEVLPLAVVLPILVIYLSLVGLIYSFFTPKKKSDKEEL